MPKSFDGKPKRFSLFGIIFVLALGYMAASILIAGATGGDCGDLSANKDWNYFPPRWECR